MAGVNMSATSAVTTAANAIPMTIPTAMSTRLPRSRNSLKSRTVPPCRGLRDPTKHGTAPTIHAMAWDQLSDEQREIRDLVRTLARERIAPRAAEIDESHTFPWDVVELYRENDIF